MTKYLKVTEWVLGLIYDHFNTTSPHFPKLVGLKVIEVIYNLRTRAAANEFIEAFQFGNTNRVAIVNWSP